MSVLMSLDKDNQEATCSEMRIFPLEGKWPDRAPPDLS